MKKSFMTRVLATGLSLAMAFSLSAATNVTTAAAASKPAMITSAGASAKTLSVNVGEKTQIKVNAATKKTYKVSAVKASSNKIRAAKNKAGTVVTIRGLVATEEGKPAAVKVSFAVKKTGKTSKYSYVSKVNVVAKEEVAKVAEISQIAQTYSNKFDVTLSAEVESAKASDFSMVRDSDNVVIVIKDAKLNDKDKTKVTLETYNSLKDGKEYTVSYTASDEAKTKSEKKITVTAGKVEALDVTPLTIPAKRATKVKVQTIDANGVILSEDDFSSLSDSKLECTVTPAVGGNIDNNKLYLAKEGDEATVEVKYHTGVYENSVETVLSKKVTITAVADTTVVDKFQMTIINSSSAPYWDASNFKANNTISVADTTKAAYFRIKDSNGDEISDAEYSNYKVASTDSTKLVLNGSDITSKNVTIVGAAEGTAYITITKDGNVVATLPVTIVPVSKATSISLSANNLSVSSESGIATSTKVTVKDQFTNNINARITSSNVTVKSAPIASGLTVGGSCPAHVGTADNKTFVVTQSAFLIPGSYQFEIAVTASNADNTSSTVKTTLVVNAVDTTVAGTGTTYELAIGNKAINTTISDTTSASDIATFIGIAQKKKGVVVGYEDMSELIIKKGTDVIFKLTSGTAIGTNSHAAIASGNDTATTMGAIAAADKTVTLTAASYSSSVFTKNLGAGNYTVYAKRQSAPTTTYTGTFTISDTQGTATVTVKSNTADNANTLYGFLQDDNKIEYSYGGLKVTSPVISNVKYYGTDATYAVKGFDIQVKVPGDNNYVVTVKVNTNFYVNNTIGSGL